MNTLKVYLALILLLGTSAIADSVLAPAPYGFTEYCLGHKHASCRNSFAVSEQDPEALSPEVLAFVNSSINSRMTYQPDSVTYGVSERWAIPHDMVGDCEDYVLAKYDLLVWFGWDPKDLHIATGFFFDRPPEFYIDTKSHAILIANLNGVDYVLDMFYNGILPLDEYVELYGFKVTRKQQSDGTWIYL